MIMDLRWEKIDRDSVVCITLDDVDIFLDSDCYVKGHLFVLYIRWTFCMGHYGYGGKGGVWFSGSNVALICSYLDLNTRAGSLVPVYLDRYIGR